MCPHASLRVLANCITHCTWLTNVARVSVCLQDLIDKEEIRCQQTAMDYAVGQPLKDLPSALRRPYQTVAMLLRNGVKPIIEHATYKSIWGVLRLDFENDEHRNMMVRIEDVCNPRSGDQSPGSVISDILHFQHYHVIDIRQAKRAGRVNCACCTKHTQQQSEAPKPIRAYLLVAKVMPCGARECGNGTKNWAYQIIPQYLCVACIALVDTAKKQLHNVSTVTRGPAGASQSGACALQAGQALESGAQTETVAEGQGSSQPEQDLHTGSPPATNEQGTSPHTSVPNKSHESPQGSQPEHLHSSPANHVLTPVGPGSALANRFPGSHAKPAPSHNNSMTVGRSQGPPRTPVTFKSILAPAVAHPRAVDGHAKSSGGTQEQMQASSISQPRPLSNAEVLRSLATTTSVPNSSISSQLLQHLNTNTGIASGSGDKHNRTGVCAAVSQSLSRDAPMAASRPRVTTGAAAGVMQLRVVSQSKSETLAFPPQIQPVSVEEEELFTSLLKERDAGGGERHLYPLSTRLNDRPTFKVSHVGNLEDGEWLNDEVINSISYAFRVRAGAYITDMSWQI